MKKIISIIVLVISSLGLFAQKDRQYPYNEIFFGLGTSHYFGQIGGSKFDSKSFLNIREIDVLQTRLSGSVGFRRVFNKNVSLSAQVDPFWLSGNDTLSFRQNRGWKFNSYGGEILSAQVEYYPLPYAYVFWGLGESYRHTIALIPDKKVINEFSPVLLGGIGYGRRIDKYNVHSIEIGLRYCLNKSTGYYYTESPRIWNDFYYLIQYKFVHRLTFGSRFNENGLLIR